MTQHANPPAQRIWTQTLGDSPIIATAIHDGHAIRPELLPYIALDEAERLREEDPFTGALTKIVDTHVVGQRSRFEVDLNRPRAKAVYLKPEDAWGLKAYNPNLPKEIVERNLAEHDAFYAAMHLFFAQIAQRHESFVILDIHTYNHRRNGPDARPAPLKENPEVNIGTGTMKNRECFAPIIDSFINDLSSFDYDGGHLDVRENIKFFGGNFAKWIHETFPENACVLSVEFKKIFMDEWTGQLDENQHGMIYAALESTLPRIMRILANKSIANETKTNHAACN